MKRTVMLFMSMAAAALAQTPTVVEKPVSKPSAATVKVAQAPATPAKPAPATVKVSAPAKPATVSVQAAPAKPVAAKPVAAKPAAAKPSVTAATQAKPAQAASSKAGAAVPMAVAVKPASAGSKPVAVPVKAAITAVPAKKTDSKNHGTQAPIAKTTIATVAAKNNKQAKSVVDTKSSAKTGTTVALQNTKTASGDKDKKEAPRPTTAAGRRDPFISPVVNLSAVGSGCSTGKRCLAIDQIALKGVVKSDAGMIAVVVNAMDKAYFLRENDPVFNGYVVKITGDSIVFKESFKDRLGKPLTRDVTKTISRPAV